METVSLQSKLGTLLSWFERRNATDLHGQTGRPYALRRQGQLMRVPLHVQSEPSPEDLEAMVREAFSETVANHILQEKEWDLSFYFGESRYRANFSRQCGRLAFSLRLVPPQTLGLKDLQLPASLTELVESHRGLVLVTGPAGQGKSTTCRALLEYLNGGKALRVITVEDPIEFLFQERECTFQQREVGIDTDSFEMGIRNAMRQDPDVLFIGEIRDAESIHSALRAAETGHLVLTTLHADSVPQAISRIREFFPAGHQENIMSLLSRNLRAAMAQRLIPNVQGGRTPCVEVMRQDSGIQQAILEGNFSMISGIMESALERGMHSFDQYLSELLAAGVVDRAVAMDYAVNRHHLELKLRGIQSNTPILYERGSKR